MKVLKEKLEEAIRADVRKSSPSIVEDEFLRMDDLVTVKKDAAKRAARGVLAEFEIMIRDKRWKDAVELFYPLEDKIPEVCGSRLEGSVRQKIAFALGQINRFDDAIRELETCISGGIHSAGKREIAKGAGIDQALPGRG